MKRGNLFGKLIIALCAAVWLLVTVTAGAEDMKPATGDTNPALFRTIGSIVTFGHYEQDNDLTNGPEAIEWIVLDVSGDKVLLLSKYGLDAKQYHKAYVGITWEKCSLRDWLNNEFLNEAFTDEEQTAILLTDVDNSSAQGYSEWTTDGGNDTQDRVFLLSCAEANRYLNVTYDDNNNLEARVVPTAYAIARGAWINHQWKTADGLDAGRWWLRSPGRHQYRAAFVYGAGSLRSTHVTSFSDHFGGNAVRPAVWIDLASGIF